MENKGFQLVEPDSLSNLNLLGTSYEVAMLHWIVSALVGHYIEYSNKFKIEVIIANYQGVYPCIGIHYLDESIPNMELEIERLIDDIIKSNPIGDFLDFSVKNTYIINETVSRL